MSADQVNAAPHSISKPTLKDVARIAGVSIWTASTAFSRPEKLKDETLARIKAASDALGYIRNGAAAALVSRRSRTIAITVPTINNPLYSEIVAYIQKILAKQNYHLLIGSHEFQYEREFEVIRSLVERGVDGAIILGSSHEQRTYDLLNSRNVPYVLSLSYDASGKHHTVGFSNFDASYDLAEVVAGMGHKRVALCGGFHQFNERAREREYGAAAALKKHGIAVPEDWKYQQAFTLQAGREVFRALWSRRIKPTALICSTDIQALGALAEAKSLGVSVPKEISITGFDNIEFAQISSPPLTTVQTPIAEIGTQSAMYLLDLINDRSPERAACLSTAVVMRDSLAPPRD